MRLEWLEDILAVSETGSFTEAADRRGLTQSAFSRRIRLIEEHVGVQLFDRTRKPVALCPTTAGQRVQIERLAGMLRELVQDLRKGAQAAANRIVIASQHALTAALTPAFIEKIRRQNENIYVRLTSANLDECFAQLLARQADIVIAYRLPGSEHPVRPDFIEAAEIGHDWLVPVIATSHLDRLELQLEAGHVPYVAYPSDVFLGQAMERSVLAPLRLRATPEPMAETALTLAALELATAGVSIAWVPLSLARRRLGEGGLVDLSDRLPSSALLVTAVRLQGEMRPVERAVWQQLAAGSAQT